MRAQVADTWVDIIPGDTVGTGDHYLVRVAPGAMTVGHGKYGKTIEFGFTLGTISPGKRPGEKKIDVWTPAASVPRGYRQKAQVMLEMAAKLVDFGKKSPAELRSDVERATGVKLRGR